MGGDCPWIFFVWGHITFMGKFRADTFNGVEAIGEIGFCNRFATLTTEMLGDVEYDSHFLRMSKNIRTIF